jgi:adenylate cyclase
MWSETYDRDLTDIFALQDEITIKLVREMGIILTLGEQARLYEKEITNNQAFDKFSRGQEHHFRFNKQDSAIARHFFMQALKLEETSALINVFLGFSHMFDLIHNWSDSPAESFVAAEKCAQKAIALKDSLDLPHSLLAFIHLYKKEHDKAIIEANKAVSLNPNGAESLVVLGFILSMSGEPEKGIIHIEKAFRLNPTPFSYYYNILGVAYMATDQYEKAIEILNQGIRIDPDSFFPYVDLTVCYIEQNEVDKAQSTAKKILEIDPDFSLEYLKSISPMKDQVLLEKIIENLRKAGLPE